MERVEKEKREEEMTPEDYVGEVVRVKKNPLGCPIGVYRVARVWGDGLQFKGIGYVCRIEDVELDPEVSFWDRVRGYLLYSPL
jgi:hypothetical protein